MLIRQPRQLLTVKSLAHLLHRAQTDDSIDTICE